MTADRDEIIEQAAVWVAKSRDRYKVWESDRGTAEVLYDAGLLRDPDRDAEVWEEGRIAGQHNEHEFSPGRALDNPYAEPLDIDDENVRDHYREDR